MNFLTELLYWTFVYKPTKSQSYNFDDDYREWFHQDKQKLRSFFKPNNKPMVFSGVDGIRMEIK